MFDSNQLLSELATLDPLDAYRAATNLHWRIRDLGANKGIQVLQSILPNVAQLCVDIDHEFDDTGCTYPVFNTATLSLHDGRTLVLPDESRLDDGDWAGGSCRPMLDAEAEQRVEARIEANPGLDRAEVMLAELGAGFGLDLDAMLLLVDVTSFLSREGCCEGGLSFAAPERGGGGDAAETSAEAVGEALA